MFLPCVTSGVEAQMTHEAARQPADGSGTFAISCARNHKGCHSNDPTPSGPLIKGVGNTSPVARADPFTPATASFHPDP